MCKMNKFPKKTLLRALRGIRSFAHSENLRIFLIKLMCSDLHSGSGSCIKVQCSSYRILSVQCCLSCFYAVTRYTACQCTCQCSAVRRCELSCLVNNLGNAVREGSTCHTVAPSAPGCHFTFAALVACLAVDDRCQKVQITGICCGNSLFASG